MSEVEARALELGVANKWDVLEGRKFQIAARVICGAHVAIGDAMLLRGVIGASEHARLVASLDPACDGADCARYERLRFGDIAVERGFVGAADLARCLEVQQREDAAGLQHRLIGEILVERGLLGEEQVREVIGALLPRP